MPIYKGTNIIKSVYKGTDDQCLLRAYKGTDTDPVFPGGFGHYIVHNKSSVIVPGGQNSTSQPSAGATIYEVPLYSAPVIGDKEYGVTDTFSVTGNTSFLTFSSSATTTVNIHVALRAKGDTARTVYCYAITSSDGGNSWLARVVNGLSLSTAWAGYSYSANTFSLNAGDLLIPFAFLVDTGGSGYWTQLDNAKHLVVQIT